jgi:recombination protein RecA
MTVIRRRAANIDPNFFPSGSTLLDCVLGGGYGRNRVVNIVGDKAVGKTLFAIEACANFDRAFPQGAMRYNEAESAFERGYGRRMGMPDRVDFVGDDLDVPLGSQIVEEFEDDLFDFIKNNKAPEKLYILDSLDALSDAAEMDKKRGDGSYGMGKPKLISEMFRKGIGPLAAANCSLFIISQIRDKIGVMFGEKKTRSGGKALDFYASQILWLSEIGKIKRTVDGIERVVGTHVRVLCKKNKLGVAFRTADIELYFNYGVDDEMSMIAWLGDNNKKGHVALGMDLKDFVSEVKAARRAQDRDTLDVLAQELRRATKERWAQIEASVQPDMSKYG